MADSDFVELARIKYRCLSMLPFTSLLSVICFGLYHGYRVINLVAAQLQNSDAYEHLYSWVYLVAELGLSLPNFFNHLLRCLSIGGPTNVQHFRLLDQDNPPRVDVFLTCAGEDLETIVNTAEAACAIDYPAHCFRLIVLDDGGSKELSQRIETLKKSRGNVYYTAREKPLIHHFKAGNLNHGYRYVESLPDGPAPFIAALDADMIPDPKWLRALMPHLMKDDNLALAQSPPRFYNVPTHDPLLQGLDVNYKITQPIKEMMGATWCLGSGYIIRRAALDSIKGYPTGSVGEDMYCSNILLGKGWHAVYVDESLQHGRVPDSYKAHVKQQGRWQVGRIQTAIGMRFYLFGDPSSKMSIRQRLAGLIYTLRSLTNILTTLALLAIPISIWSGHAVVVYSSDGDLQNLLGLATACVISEWLDDCVVSLITGYRIAVAEGHATYWIAPYNAAAIISAFLPSWLQRKPFAFTASGSSNNDFNERDGTKTAPFSEKVAAMFLNCKIFLHLTYFTICSAGIVRSAILFSQREHETRASFIEDFVTHVGWPPLLWLVCLNSVAIPIRYALLPPTNPQLEQLLKRDPVLRASYPKRAESTGEHMLSFGQEACYSFCMVYTMGLFIYARNYCYE